MRTPLNNTAYKLKIENSLNVAYLGGTVTNGYGSTDNTTKSWRALSYEYLRTQYPNADITMIDSSVGGIGSRLGMYYVDDFVVSKDADPT